MPVGRKTREKARASKRRRERKRRLRAAVRRGHTRRALSNIPPVPTHTPLPRPFPHFPDVPTHPVV